MLGVAPVIDALDALAAGDASEAVFTAIGDDWDVEERSRAQLDRLGLADVALDRPLGSLCGGEVVSVGLAAQLLRRPDVLLLDEPTNNLDLDARLRLYDALDDFGGTLLVVSHDRVLLDRMDRIAELHRGEIVFYGGNFSAYAECRRRSAAGRRGGRAQRRTILKREKRQMQQARERAARRSGTAARNVKNAGLPKIVAGKLKRDAQESAARSDDVHAKRIDDARQRLDEAERAVRDDDAIVLDLPDTDVPAGRTVVAARGVQVARGGRKLFADNGIDLDIRGPERIALTGRTGRASRRCCACSAGTCRPKGRCSEATAGSPTCPNGWTCSTPTAPSPRAWPRFAPNLSHTRRMHLLAQFLFRGDRIHLPVSALSGGERLRATLVCVLHAEPAPQLLLLDEPTNNLDLVSVAQLESALNAYRGAFVVVSHDERFIDAIGVERRLVLADGPSEATGMCRGRCG